MEIDEFWEIVEAARSVPQPFDEALLDQLVRLPADQIVAFDERFDQLQLELYRWDVWGAAYLIGGGCSDDAFIDFRAGVISFGRHWYERVLAHPDSLAEHPLVQAEGGDQFEELFYEEANYVARQAFQKVAGSAEFPHTPVLHDRDMGEEFDFDDLTEMRRRYPGLAPICL
jgi:hypothetical protein